MQYFFDWLKNDWREYYLYIDVRYIMDSHHTNKTFQEEYKEQFKYMTDEQIEQHIVMERGGNILRCWIKIR